MGKTYKYINGVLTEYIDADEAVRVVEQSFTDTEKAQARTNIGAAEKSVVDNILDGTTAVPTADEATHSDYSSEAVYSENSDSVNVVNDNETNIANGFNQSHGDINVNYRGATQAVNKVKFCNGMGTGVASRVAGADATDNADFVTKGQLLTDTNNVTPKTATNSNGVNATSSNESIIANGFNSTEELAVNYRGATQPIEKTTFYQGRNTTDKSRVAGANAIDNNDFVPLGQADTRYVKTSSAVIWESVEITANQYDTISLSDGKTYEFVLVNDYGCYHLGTILYSPFNDIMGHATNVHYSCSGLFLLNSSTKANVAISIYSNQVTVYYQSTATTWVKLNEGLLYYAEK